MAPIVAADVGSSVVVPRVFAGIGDGLLRLLFFASATVANFFCTASFTQFNPLEHTIFQGLVPSRFSSLYCRKAHTRLVA